MRQKFETNVHLIFVFNVFFFSSSSPNNTSYSCIKISRRRLSSALLSELNSEMSKNHWKIWLTQCNLITDYCLGQMNGINFVGCRKFSEFSESASHLGILQLQLGITCRREIEPKTNCLTNFAVLRVPVHYYDGIEIRGIAVTLPSPQRNEGAQPTNTPAHTLLCDKREWEQAYDSESFRRHVKMCWW